jgi:predicted O-methyltransferase YrrM
LATLLGVSKGYFIPYRYAQTSRAPASYPGLEPLFTAAQREFEAQLHEAAKYSAAFDSFRGAAAPSPRFEQDWFPGLDAAVAYALVRQRRPRRIVEIGSGHSTRFLARAVADEGIATSITAIDPQPRAALAGLAVTWVRKTLQTAGRTPFAELGPGDILFIDSSHILMPGSDVDILLNEVWPRLPAGTLVHVHDILLPDAYPLDWAWRGYNEQNALAPLLGSQARLLWSSHWARTRLAAEVAEAGLDRLPLPTGARETSLWLEKS